MARLHVLAGTSARSYRLILHEPIAATNNAVGVPYRTALIASGMGGTTVMTEGNGAGQITTAEKAQIAAGEIIEVEFQFLDDPALTNAQRNAVLDAQVANLSTETQDRVQIGLRYFGHTRAN